MGYLNRMGFFDHLAPRINVSPGRPASSGAVRYSGYNNGLVEIARINRDHRDPDLPTRLAEVVETACAKRHEVRALSPCLCLREHVERPEGWGRPKGRVAYPRLLTFVDSPARIELVARFDETDASRLLEDPGIIRSLAKIEATIGGARAYLKMQTGGEDFSTLVRIWPAENRFGTPDEFPPALLCRKRYRRR